ncbi:MAG: sulfite exporter TauE/SafE family protein [Rhodospirillales bacterium]|nr:sulfite exporter TauE/SafE family protein [Rhodospirillales bacterium]
MPIELVIPLGALLAAFVVAAAGFGDALVLGAIWFQVIDPVDAVPLIVACGFSMHVLPLIRLRRELDYGQLPVFAVMGVLGVPLGAWLLVHIQPGPFRLAIGWFLILYIGFVFVMPRGLKVSAGGKAADGLVGLAGGVLGGFAGLSGIAPTLWAGLRDWPKAGQRGVYQPFCLIMHAVTFAWLSWQGLVDIQTFERLLWALPAIAVGTWLGLMLYKKLDDRLFRQMILGLILVSGVALIV